MIFVLALALSVNAETRVNSPEVDGMCGFTEFPAPFLGNCDESLHADAAGFEGNWVSTEGAFHYERIETCGSRLTAVTGKQTMTQDGQMTFFAVHDWPAMDGTFTNGAMDKRIATMPDCDAFAASGSYVEIQTPMGSFPCIQFVSSTPASVITKCLTDVNELTWTVQIAGSNCMSVRKLKRTTKSYTEELLGSVQQSFDLEGAEDFLNQRVGFYNAVIAAPNTPANTKMLASFRLTAVETILSEGSDTEVVAKAIEEYQTQYIQCA